MTLKPTVCVYVLEVGGMGGGRMVCVCVCLWGLGGANSIYQFGMRKTNYKNSLLIIKIMTFIYSISRLLIICLTD